MLSRKTLPVILVIFIAAIIITILLVLRISTPDTNNALPFNITITFGRNVETDKNFCWFTEADKDISYIQYQEDSGTGFDSYTEIKAVSEKIIRKYPKDNSQNNETIDKEFYRHRAYLTGLKPATKYLYRMGDGNTFTEVYSFTTPDSDNEFGFIIVADSQGFSKKDFEYYTKVLNAAERAYPEAAFYVHLGDFIEDGHDALQWSYVLNLPSAIMRKSTFVPVAGNQDDMYVFDHFTLGTLYDSTEMATGWYSFNFKDMHFTILNTSSNNQFSKKQINWIRDDLSKNSDKRTIVLTHKAPYTNANHADDTDIVDLRTKLLPIFDEFGVMAVLQGHDHYFFRSEPIYQGVVGSYSLEQKDINGDIVDMYDVEQGTVYLINSSSGNKQYSKTFRTMDDIFAVKSFNLKNPTFTYCAVSSDNIIFKTYEVNVTTRKVTLIDAFGLSS